MRALAVLGMAGAALGALAAVAVAQVGGRVPQIAAHRGGALLWPENSLLAYRNALGLGVELLETDVHLTADGQVIVLHDPTLDRTTTGAGAVRDVTLAALGAIRLKAGDGTPTEEPVPTLIQLLELIQPTAAHLLLEIKVGPGRVPYPGIEERALALVKERGLLDRTVVMAFEDDAIRRVRALEPRVRTALLIGRGRVERAKASPADVVAWANAVGATHLGVDHRVVDAALVGAARAAGLGFASWTVNEEADIRRVLDLGVDVVISDRPDLARRLRGR